MAAKRHWRTALKYSILGIGAAALLNSTSASANINSFKNKPVFRGTVPTTAANWNKGALLLEDIPSGCIGPALAVGASAVQITVNNVNHAWADVTNNSSAALTSYATGSVRILSTLTATGLQWAYAQFGYRFTGMLIGKADAAIAAAQAVLFQSGIRPAPEPKAIRRIT